MKRLRRDDPRLAWPLYTLREAAGYLDVPSSTLGYWAHPLQRFVGSLLAQRLSSATVRATVQPLSLVFGHAIDRGELVANPCQGVKLPSARKARRRYADPNEAAALLAALPEGDRPLWATAFYAGLRLGELQALRVEDVDLATGVIHVRRGWDAREGEQVTKSNRVRRVPILGVLRDYLLDHLAGTGRRGSELIFGRSARSPFVPNTIQPRADKAWAEAGLERITPHGCRYSYGSILIAAGVNAKAVQTFMGHGSIDVTFDVYGHLFPGSEHEATRLTDDYLAAQIERGAEAARAADRVHESCLTGELTGEQLRTSDSARPTRPQKRLKQALSR